MRKTKKENRINRTELEQSIEIRNLFLELATQRMKAIGILVDLVDEAQLGTLLGELYDLREYKKKHIKEKGEEKCK